jgi:thiamine biosynthesis lipoprotein
MDLEFKGDHLWLGRFAAMASPCEVLLESPDLDQATVKTLLHVAAEEAWRLEAKFSRYKNDSVIGHINKTAGQTVTVDDETAMLLDYADQCYELSGGKFDISSGPLRHVWQFRGQEFRPDLAQLRQVLERVGWHKCLWQKPQLTLLPGAEIDLGGIGKEYAVDRTLRLLLEGAPGARLSLLINYGGDVVCSGPRLNGSAWVIGLEALGNHAGDRALELAGGGIATSGDTHRFLLFNGKRLSHILDPQTGWPVPDAPQTVTVKAASCTLAGMLATFAMLQGAAAETFLEAQGVQYWIQRLPSQGL